MPDPCAELIDQVIAMRKDAGLSQAQLAQLTGMRQQNIARMESKKNWPSIDTLQRVLSALDCTLTIKKQK